MMLPARLPTAATTSEPGREPVAQAEAARREALLVRGADGARVGDVGRVDVGRQGRDERVEDVGAEGHEGREEGVSVREGDVEAEDCRGVGACVFEFCQSLLLR